MERRTLFVDVLLPLNVPNYYTYRVPAGYNDVILSGQRVVVQFGQKKLYSALVRRVHENTPKDYIAKYFLSILDETPLISETQFLFWEWIARYYMCPVGSVMAVALPSGFRLASESMIVVHPDFDGEYSALNENEKIIVEALVRQHVLSVNEIEKITGLQKTFPLLKSMMDKNIISMEEELQLRYRPKEETYLSLHHHYKEGKNLEELFLELEKKTTTRKQVDALLFFLKYATEGEVKKSILLEDKSISLSALNTLVKKEVLLTVKKIESRLRDVAAPSSPDAIILNPEQTQAFETIISNWNEKKITLLHGVTSSGKTEIFIKLIEETLKQNKQVLYLMPEIALTAQIINRLRKYFGEKVGIYHSRFNINERSETWTKVQKGEENYKIILGARSAVFLPFADLGLIIVDEEHDTSYKQLDPAPRYHARDAAMYLAALYGAKTILASATPSVESYYNAQNGKYQLVELKKRFGGVLLPEIFVSDLKEATKKKEMKSHFSAFLLEHIKEALDDKEQVILFQNRRGFSLRLECDTCHWIPGCKHCDVSLVYHKGINMLRCHYCGYSIPVMDTCPACGTRSIKMKGFGTEKIEEELAIFFPNARIARMDLDTTRSKTSYMQIISDFEDRRIDILVGTQMITKGLDFDNVSIVGILNADNMLFFPDFRAFERSFQQMSQVSGRAGRKNKRGKVVIQTYNPYHQAIRDVIEYNFSGMFNSQLIERRVFKYPPFYRLIKISLRHKDDEYLNKAALYFASELKTTFGKRVLGPESPPVARVRNLFQKDILLKMEKELSPSAAKNKLTQILEAFIRHSDYCQIRYVIDVDPQ